MKLETPVKHLLIDLDGTLLGSNEFPLAIHFTAQALRRLSAHGGLRKGVQALRAMMRELETPSLERTNEERATSAFSRELGIAKERADTLIRDSISAIFPRLERHFFPVPGAKDFLLWASKQYPMTLATNPVWSEDIVRLRLKWAGIEPSLFTSVTHAARMHAIKPSPEYYRELLEQEGLAPEDCLLVGDGMNMDLPATRVGIRVFIVGARREFRRLSLNGASSPAWQGTFQDLQRLLKNTG